LKFLAPANKEFQITIAMVSRIPHNGTNLQQGQSSALCFTELEINELSRFNRKDKVIFWYLQGAEFSATEANDAIVKYTAPNLVSSFEVAPRQPTETTSHKNLKVIDFIPVARLVRGICSHTAD